MEMQNGVMTNSIRIRISVACASLACAWLNVDAQNAPIPVVTVKVLAESKETFAERPFVQGLPGGRVLIGDRPAGRIGVFDSTLTSFTLSADSAGKSGVFLNPFSTRLYPYSGDSSLIVDSPNRSFVVIGSDGKLGRSMAHPKYTDFQNLNSPYGTGAASDNRGRFIYRAKSRPLSERDTSRASTRDSIAIVRADFDSRVIDTLAAVTVPKITAPKIDTKVVGPGRHRIGTMIVNPILESPDDWAVMTDGTLAILRQGDYHIDWIGPNGERSSSQKLPFDWRRLTDADKQARIDSMKRIIDSLDRTDKPFSTMIRGMIAEDGLPMFVRATGQRRMDTIPLVVSFAPLSEIPDYIPPIGPGGGLKADMDNNLWILPSTSSAAGNGLAYDVVNREGKLFQRVRVPKDCVIVGFGRGGIVLLAKNDVRSKTWTLVRARVPIAPRP